MQRTPVVLQRYVVEPHFFQSPLPKAPPISRVDRNGVIGTIETGEEENATLLRKAEYPEPPQPAGLIDGQAKANTLPQCIVAVRDPWADP